MKYYYDVAELGDNVVDMVGHLANIGVQLRVDKGKLIYRAQKGVLDEDDIAALRVFKEQAIVLLGGYLPSGGETEAGLQPEDGGHLAPLSFSQLAHWHAFRLGERPSYALPGIATRWRGQLNLGALRGALNVMVQRHDALRTGIVVQGGTPIQKVWRSWDYELPIDDLTGMDDHLRHAELERVVYEQMRYPLKVKEFPLFRFRLVRVRDEEHVLVIAMEHIITDGVSLNIMQTELFSTYLDMAEGRDSSLPPVSMQFSDYARQQRSTVQAWIGSHYPYWKQRMNGCQRVRFPADRNDIGRGGVEVLTFRIGRELRTEARDWCRQARTTLVMCFFVAFVALVLRWCDVPECVFLFQTDGRTASTLHTFGYLSSPLYLRLALGGSDTYWDLLRRVTEEYCNAREHADSSFLEAQLPLPGVSRNTRFNWLHLEPAVTRLERPGLQHAIDVSRLDLEDRDSPHFARDIEPALGFVETSEEIIGFVAYRVDRFSMRLMEKFTRNYLLFVEALLRSPEKDVKGICME